MRPAVLLRLAVVLTVVPLIVSAVALLLGPGDYVAIGDLAATELITRDVGRHAVELGPYSRDGWHHPGPALFYVLVSTRMPAILYECHFLTNASDEARARTRPTCTASTWCRHRTFPRRRGRPRCGASPRHSVLPSRRTGAIGGI